MLHLPLMLRGLAMSRYFRREQEQQQEQEEKRSRSPNRTQGANVMLRLPASNGAYHLSLHNLQAWHGKPPAQKLSALRRRACLRPAHRSSRSSLARSSRASLSKTHRAWRIMGPSPHAFSILKSPRRLSNLQSWHGAVSTPLIPALTLGLNQVWSRLVASPHSCPCVGLDMRSLSSSYRAQPKCFCCQAAANWAWPPRPWRGASWERLHEGGSSLSLSSLAASVSTRHGGYFVH